MCFAFRSNSIDMIEMLIKHPRIDLDIVSPKYGCPLHLSILKHKFNLAVSLIEQHNANPHILNPNGSNAMQILFANY